METDLGSLGKLVSEPQAESLAGVFFVCLFVCLFLAVLLAESSFPDQGLNPGHGSESKLTLVPGSYASLGVMTSVLDGFTSTEHV